MLFGIVLIALIAAHAVSTITYWTSGAEPRRAATRLRIANAAVGIGLVALVSIAWDGLAIEAEPCSHYGRASDLRSGEEYVLGSCLVAAGLSLIMIRLDLALRISDAHERRANHRGLRILLQLAKPVHGPPLV